MSRRTPGPTASRYLRQFLGFIGLTEVEFVLAEGLAMGEATRDRSLQGAGRRVDELESLAAAA